jgi:serine/threonine-protein kinase
MAHRDIKPANLMVAWATQGGRVLEPAPAGWPNAPLVKILDFGLARLAAGNDSGEANAVSALTRVGSVVGTPAYMSPEQAKDSRLVDIRSDIYSLGCTLYELLVGKPPFVSPTAFEIIAQHLNQTPEPISKHCPAVPAGLEAVVMRTLAKQPADRYATPLEFATALQPWAAGTERSSGEHSPRPATPAPTVSPPTPAPRTVPRPAAAPHPMPPAVGLDDIAALFKTFFLVALLVFVGFLIVAKWDSIMAAFDSFSQKMSGPHSSESAPNRQNRSP